MAAPARKPLTHTRQADTAKPETKPYTLNAGNGLFLEVMPNGSKRWRFRYFFMGKEKMLSMGLYPDVGLQAATTARDTARQLVAQGINPSEQRKAENNSKREAHTNTFEIVAAEWFEKQSPHWSATHKARTVGMLRNNLGRWLGTRPVGEITAPELLAALRNTEKCGTLETAKRSLQIAGQVFRYAVQTGRAERDPSQDLKGALATPKVKHFAAITEPAALGKLLLAMDGYSGTPEVRAALQLSALLFQRPNEIRHIEWSEIDWQQQRWEIPAEKMKMRQPHIVPLCRQVLEILRQMQPLTGNGRYVFPSARAGGRAMCENAVRGALRSLGYTNDQQTPHGFRATARTILDEVLNYRVDLIEHQLAHAVKDANGTAYNRTKHLPARLEMMQGWADYLDELRAIARGDNVTLGNFGKGQTNQ
jgi:integrase